MVQKKPLVFLVVLDHSEEVLIALYYACRCAKRQGGKVGLLYVINPPDFQHWKDVEEKLHEENRHKAESHVLKYAEEIYQETENLAIFYIREGNRREELLKLIKEDKSISALVLAASTDPNGPGPLISYLTSTGSPQLHIPLIVVPGNMQKQEIERLT